MTIFSSSSSRTLLMMIVALSLGLILFGGITLKKKGGITKFKQTQSTSVNDIYEQLKSYYTSYDETTKFDEPSGSSNNSRKTKFKIRGTKEIRWNSCQPQLFDDFNKFNDDNIHNLVDSMKSYLEEDMNNEEEILCGSDFKINDLCVCVSSFDSSKTYFSVNIIDASEDGFFFERHSRYCKERGFFELIYPEWIMVEYYVEEHQDSSIMKSKKIIRDQLKIVMLIDMYEKMNGWNICHRKTLGDEGDYFNDDYTTTTISVDDDSSSSYMELPHRKQQSNQEEYSLEIK